MYTLIEYAYPSSNTAEQNGFGATGCYTVVLCPDNTFSGWKDLAAYATRSEAETHADTLGLSEHPCKTRLGQ
jgi:hypothetical protein